MATRIGEKTFPPLLFFVVVGSGIKNKHPGSATLLAKPIFMFLAKPAEYFYSLQISNISF